MKRAPEPGVPGEGIGHHLCLPSSVRGATLPQIMDRLARLETTVADAYEMFVAECLERGDGFDTEPPVWVEEAQRLLGAARCNEIAARFNFTDSDADAIAADLTTLDHQSKGAE